MTISVILILTISVCALAWPIPDSGQTKCSDNEKVIPCPNPGEDFYGQDANYSINPRSYTKLDAQGNGLSDSAAEWAMVRDNVTGLIWEVKQAKDGVEDYSNPHDADNTYTWYDSNPETNGGNAGAPGDGTDTEDFINALNSEKFGGYSDWQLPTIKELASIVNLGQYNPAIDTKYFSNTNTSGYWASSYPANASGSAWFVGFYYGNAYDATNSGDWYVRAVRGGQIETFDSLLINGDGTVTDIRTDLTWQQQVPSSTKEWKEALSYCESLSLAGYSDWRLPTREELRSIVDYEKFNPATDTKYFPSTSSRYWCSSPVAYDPEGAWSMDFDYGRDYYSTRSYNSYVRAVRGGQADSSSDTRFRAIIVAGGGPYPENNIWDGTQICTANAYRTLVYQGYSKDSIYYLSADPANLDLDRDGIPETVHEATNSNLEYAITTWAEGAENLLIHIVGHGGIGKFRMNFRMTPDEKNFLRAEVLDYWLDSVETGISGKIILIYDACYSGSFLAPLAGRDRILVASTSANEQAVFGEEGTISFSFYFWGRIFSGDSFYKAFRHARESIRMSDRRQDAQLDSDGDGLGNERSDQDIAAEIRIGNEIKTAPDIPRIGSVSPSQNLENRTSALIYAENVSGLNGIQRVWAVITPPEALNTSTGEPVTELRTVELTPAGNDRYEATYYNFETKGTYSIVIFAEDSEGFRSYPKGTAVIQNNGYFVTDDLWIRAVISTLEKGPIEAVWQEGGRDTDLVGGHKVIWGHFYASPDDVTWGSRDNPDLFVKIWFDAGGRTDVNFFHVSAPDIEVYSDYPYDGDPDEYGVTTMQKRYIRQYYQNGMSDSEEKYEDGEAPAGYLHTGNPAGYSAINNLRFGSLINTEDRGPIEAKWRFGGQDDTAGGHQVVWGHFYASPSDVGWGSPENPDLFVKIWFDVSRRIDVNFFHVSVPDIEVYSDFPNDGDYDKKGR